MSRVLGLLALCVLLVIVRAILIAVAVVAVLALLYAFVQKPRETLIFIGVMTLSGAASAQPLAAVIALCVVGVLIALITWRRTTGGGSKSGTDLLDH